MSKTIDFSKTREHYPRWMQKPKFLASRPARRSPKQNVGKFLILGLVLMAFLFMVAGLLFYQKYKLAHPSVKNTRQE